MKNKNNLKKMALIGLAGGALIVNSQASAVQYSKGIQNYTAEANAMSHTASTKVMTATELMSVLNPEGKATFQRLNDEGKALALKLANQSCKGKNDCKGLNSCKTSENTCAGLGGCKGASLRPFADKNNAVKLAAKHMAEKRSNVMQQK